METGWDGKGRKKVGGVGDWPASRARGLLDMRGRQSSELELEMGRNRQIQEMERNRLEGWRWRYERGSR